METTGSAESATAIAFGTRVGWRNTPWADYLAEVARRGMLVKMENRIVKPAPFFAALGK